MNLKELIKALTCNSSTDEADNLGCSNKKCKYRDVDGACDTIGMCEDAAIAIKQLAAIMDTLSDDYDLDRLRELVEADRENAVHIGACGFCEYYQMDKFCCCPDWVEDDYAIVRNPKDYCTKFKKAGWVDEVWGENGCPSCLGYKPEKAEQEGRT